MANPTALESVRTGTPDSSQGVQIANISAQENSAYEIPAGVILSDVLTAGQSAHRADLSAADTTADMSTSGFAGASGANLENLNNRATLIVWCRFSDSGGTARIHPIFYDSQNTPLFVGPPLSFSAMPQRASSSGAYLSIPLMCETYGASKFRCYLSALGTGNVTIFAQGI